MEETTNDHRITVLKVLQTHITWELRHKCEGNIKMYLIKIGEEDFKGLRRAFMINVITCNMFINCSNQCMGRKLLTVL
jgi:hypothetical protein